MAFYLKSVAYTRMFKMIDSADHLSKKTGLTCTVNISKAGAAFGAAGGTVSEVANGWYKVALSTTDTNTAGDLAFYITASGADDTDFVDQVVDPTAANLGVNVVNWNNTVVATPATAGIPDVNVKNFNNLTAVALPLVPTTAGRTLDVSATGEAGVDWANVGSPTTAVDLSGTTIKTTQKVDVDTIKTNPVVNGGTITFPTNATVASTTGAVGSVTGNVGGNVTGSVGSVAAGGIAAASFAAGAIDATAIAANAIGASELATDAVNEIRDAILSDSTPFAGGNIDAAISTRSTFSPTAALTESYAADGAAATTAQLLYMLWAALSEFGISGTTISCKKLDGATEAMTFTLDDATNPTSRTRAT